MKKKNISVFLCVTLLLAVCWLLPVRADAVTEGYYTYEISNGKATITDCDTSVSGDIVIPSTLGDCPVTTIGDNAFYKCISLTSITIPDSVITIGDNAFATCSSLTSVAIGDNVNSIGWAAFAGCSSLTSITIPDSVTNIDDYAFLGCSGLTRVTIGDSVTQIYDCTFGDCSSLSSVIIGDGVTRIDHYAFFNCDSLTSITIPDSVTTIGSYAFTSCDSLTSITIGKGLTSITIMDNDISIGASVFCGCSSLTGIWVDADNSKYASDDCGVLFNKTKTSLIQAPAKIAGSYSVPNSVTAIGDYAFYGCSSLTDITIPDSITSIGDCAFYNCDNLNYNIHNEGKYLGNNINPRVALIGTSSTFINSFQIHPECKVIGTGAFRNCRSLSSVTIPNSVTTIGDYAFAGCQRLNSINIPDSVTSIGYVAFSGCSNLTNVTIGDGVTSIGFEAFSRCSSLKHVAYSGTQSQWNQISIGSYNTALTNATRHYETIFIYSDNCAGSSAYCPVCEIYIYQSQNANVAHNYGDWVVTKPASLTATGQKEQVCTSCGNTNIESIDMLIGKVDHWNITLEDDYAVNFYLQISQSIEKTANVKISIGNEASSYNVSSLEKTEDGYYRLTTDIAAAQMNDLIIVIVMNGREVGSTEIYTAREYCDTILADLQYSQYHALVKEMLHYGAMAQVYFGYNTDNLANAGITGVASVAVPNAVQDLKLTDNLGSLDFYGASLVYRDKIAVRYYFAGDVTGCSFIANGKTCTPIVKDGMYYIEIEDILPQNLGQQITVTVIDTQGNTMSVTYGPMNYIVRMNEKGSAELRNLMKALYNYHLTAKSLVV